MDANDGLQGHDDFSSGMTRFDVPQSLWGLAQRIRAVDDRRQLADFNEFLRHGQVVVIRHGEIPALALADKRRQQQRLDKAHDKGG